MNTVSPAVARESPRGALYVPIAVFVVTSTLLWIGFGVRPANDSMFFVSGAEQLRRGQLVHVGYLGYMAFVAIVQSAGLGPRGVMFGQWLLSGCVVIALFDLGRRLGGRLAGGMAATLYAVNVDILRFTFYILSDSLFTSTLLLAVYAAYRATTEAARRWTFAALGLGLATGVMRFNGWFMWPLLFEWTIRASRLRPPQRWAVRIGVTLCYVPLLLTGLAMTRSTDMGDGLLRDGRVIWADRASAVPMPSAPAGSVWLPPAIDYMVRYPVTSAALIARRVVTEGVHTRRFYSRSHNLAIAIVMPLLYGLAAVGWWASRRSSFAWLCAWLLGTEMLLVGLTSADWDGRYLVMVLPIVTLWSGVGLARTYEAGMRRERVG